MALLDDLAAGTLGLEVTPPGGLTLIHQDDMAARFEDAERGMGFWFFFFPDVHLDLSATNLPLLRRDVQRHARLLFETMFQHRATESLPGDTQPRTHDQTWSPVIEIELCDLVGGAGLSVLHRMEYQPTRESVMGHTLVPVASGLFEARWLCRTDVTGLRESFLMIKEGSLDDGPCFPPQEVYDDPAHDPTFPAHPLSVARTARRWHEDGHLRVVDPPADPPAGELALEAIACAITPPPRFLFGGATMDAAFTMCHLDRVSFAGTDGIDRLVILRFSDRVRGIAVERRLVRLARERATDLLTQSGYRDVTCTISSVDSDAPSVVVVTEGAADRPGCGRGRAVWRWFLDGRGAAWTLAIITTVAVPVDELTADVTAVARSWRPL